jgi:hypothetical protein
MKCKNCNHTIVAHDKFCSNCGAKIVVAEITIKNLFKDFYQNILGWDNKYFFTIKKLFLQPDIVLKEYLNGTRKKYLPPITFLLIGMGISLFFFNIFDDHFITSQTALAESQAEFMAEKLGGPLATGEFKTEQIENSKRMSTFMLKYFNLTTMVLLPLYSFLTFLVFGKPYRYAEHLVINCYLQGITFIGTLIFFFISILVHPLLYLLGSIFVIRYYCYGYKRLYKLSFWGIVLKLFLFIGIVLSAFVLIGIAGAASTIIEKII